MLSSYTSPYAFTPSASRAYFSFGWPARGSVLVTSFGVRVVAQGANVEFSEGLANYATSVMSWAPYANDPALYQITLDQYHSVDANTGEQTPVKTCTAHTTRRHGRQSQMACMMRIAHTSLCSSLCTTRLRSSEAVPRECVEWRLRARVECGGAGRRGGRPRRQGRRRGEDTGTTGGTTTTPHAAERRHDQG